MPRYFVEREGERVGKYVRAGNAWVAAHLRETEDWSLRRVIRVWRIFAGGKQRILKERSWK